MRPIVQPIATAHTPESLVERLQSLPLRTVESAKANGVVLLRSALFDSPQARYSFVAAKPFLVFRSFGSKCEIVAEKSADTGKQGKTSLDAAVFTGGYFQFGNPWRLLDSLMARFELLDEIDHPFPLGGCFGYWGYDLKNFVEPKLSRRAVNDLELPDCHVGFYDSLVVFDHRLGKTWIVSTGLHADGARNEGRARQRAEFWQECLEKEPTRCGSPADARMSPAGDNSCLAESQPGARSPFRLPLGGREKIFSNITRDAFLAAVAQAQRYIRAGDIYQVNLSQRLMAACPLYGWGLFERLRDVSPAPFAAYFDCGDFQMLSSSPELFLRLNGANIVTRPIKGTRPRSSDPTRDAQLAYELQTSAKELAELLMITDLLRNDLGKVCEFGTVHVPELMRLECYPQVQHLVSTIEGRLRPGVTHFTALASCFPGGSITGAPKFRAMEIIDELEPVARGPYTGCHGYLGFNRESQLSISIRTAIWKQFAAYFHVGAGIVADSIPVAEYEETLTKAGGFLAALQLPVRNEVAPSQC